MPLTQVLALEFHSTAFQARAAPPVSVVAFAKSFLAVDLVISSSIDLHYAHSIPNWVAFAFRFTDIAVRHRYGSSAVS